MILRNELSPLHLPVVHLWGVPITGRIFLNNRRGHVTQFIYKWRPVRPTMRWSVEKKQWFNFSYLSSKKRSLIVSIKNSGTTNHRSTCVTDLKIFIFIGIFRVFSLIFGHGIFFENYIFLNIRTKNKIIILTCPKIYGKYDTCKYQQYWKIRLLVNWIDHPGIYTITYTQHS